jgi:hypothetical protein
MANPLFESDNQKLDLLVGVERNLPLADILVAGYDQDGELFVASTMSDKEIAFILDEMFKLLHGRLDGIATRQ